MANLPSLFVAIAIVAFARATPLPEGDSSIARAAAEIVDPKDYRLPQDVVPVSYKLLLSPNNLKDEPSTFDGEVEILITVKKATKQIVLHANDTLTIKSAKLSMLNSTELVILSTPRNKINDFLTIELNSTLVIDTNYKLKLVFEGKLNDDLRGFYRSYYIIDGQKRWLATTHFEPTSARLAFPCWDEPHLKATFNISIRHPFEFHAISNMQFVQMIAEPTDSNKRVTTFATTPLMSTYLVAFVVSDYKPLSNNGSTSFNIWARPNAIQHGRFALETGEKELKELEKYTGISHASNGFNKMDSIAIPQFAAGAMENWGLVTYRESALLVEENVTTTASIESVATVMSHEFAHQWFGNLVSPLWWQYTWLNEGFATYFQYIITDKIFPLWRLKDLQVVVALQNTAFAGDSVSTAVEMDYNVTLPKNISAKFNSISYQKAGSVIRMIAHVLTEQKFQPALQRYLQKMKFKAAISKDLFDEFVKDFPVLPGTVKAMDVLNNWATTPGFPLINVTRDYEKGTVNITQERYLYKPDDAHKETYYVPINYAKEKKDFDVTTATNWLEKDKPIIGLNVSAVKTKWIIFNKQHFGYYRVNYDEQNWKLITEALKTKDYEDIHVLNRGQLVDDALNLARNGKLNYNVALDLMEFLKKDFDYVPWSSALTGFSYLQKTLANTASYPSFKTYVLGLLEPVLKNVTYHESPTDDHLRKLLRVQVVNWACTLGLKDCRDQASTNVTNWLKDSKANKLVPDLKNVVLCAGVRNADQATWEKLFAKYFADKEDSLLAALGCSSNTAILKGYLTKAIDKSVNITNRDGVFEAVTTSSEEGVNVALDFVLANADKIYELAGNKNNTLGTYITTIGSRITTKGQLDKLEKATNKHVMDVRADGVNRAKESLAWIAMHEKQFVEYFKKKDTNGGKASSAVTVTVSSILFILTFTVSAFY